MLAALLLVPLTALAAPQTEDDLTAALRAARDDVDAGRPGEARAEVLAAVEALAGAPEVVAWHWAEVEELLALADFRSEYELPGPREVVGGRLLSYSDRSGKIKLRYGGRSGDDAWREDFVENDNVLVHPALFKGPYHVELSGPSLPPWSVARSFPIVVVGYDWDTAYAVSFASTVRALALESGRLRLLDDCTHNFRYGEPYTLKVSLAATSMTAYYNGKRLLKVKRPRGSFGQFGFLNVVNLEEVTITGEVEPSWIAGLIDAHENVAWAEFLREHDALATLPAWVPDAVGGEAADAAKLEEAAPPSASEKGRATIQRLLDELSAGRVANADAVVEHAADVSAPTLDWCRALLALFRGDLDGALAALDETLAIDDGFLEARLLRAQLLQARRSADEAEQELRDAVRDFPDNAAPRRALSEHLLHRERYDDAHGAVVAAIEDGIPAVALAGVERNRLRALHGPRFAEPYEYVSKNYVVVSDMGRQACFEVAQELEKFFLKYNTHVRRLPSGDDRRFRVYLFSGLAGYETYCRDLFGQEPESELGRYSLTLKQLLIWNSPDRRRMMRTVRHEGFHQYLDRLSGEAPVWLHEGMAEYFEQAKIVRGRWQDDMVEEQHLALLARAEWTPLERFVHLESRGFRAQSALHYAQGWAFVHFLSNGSRRDDRVRLDALLDALAAGAPRAEALARAFGDADWPDLEQRFREHVAALR